MRSLEPQLQQYHAEFRRLVRLQRWSVAVAPLGMLAYGLIVITLGPLGWVDRIFVGAVLGACSLVIVSSEIRKFIVFRRDLRERRTHGPAP